MLELATRTHGENTGGEVAYRDLREFVRALDPPSQRLASADLRVRIRRDVWAVMLGLVGLLRRTYIRLRDSIASADL